MQKLNLKNNCLSIWPLAIYMIAFYTLDTLRIYMNSSYLYVDRLVVWVVPIFLFIRFGLQQNPFDYLKLSKNIMRGVFWGALISGVHAALYVAFWYFWKGNVIVDWGVSFNDFWHVVLTVGLTEEIVFRGFVLGYLRNIYNFKTANIVSSLLFMVAHIPYWFVAGQFSLPLYKIIYGFVFVFALGLLWGFLVKKTNSLWTSIIHHSVNNFLAFMVK